MGFLKNPFMQLELEVSLNSNPDYPSSVSALLFILVTLEKLLCKTFTVFN